MGSTNGILVNGEAVTPMVPRPLRPEDSIEIEKIVIQARWIEELEEPDAPATYHAETRPVASTFPAPSAPAPASTPPPCPPPAPPRREGCPGRGPRGGAAARAGAPPRCGSCRRIPPPCVPRPLPILRRRPPGTHRPRRSEAGPSASPRRRSRTFSR